LNDAEQRTLGRIADELAGSAPELTSMLTVFNRLTSGEDMPSEAHAVSGTQAPGARRPGNRIRRQLLPITAVALTVIAAIVVTVVMTLTSHGSGAQPGCTPSWAVVCPDTEAP